MVCLGNICRSPLAEGIMAAKAKNSDLHVDSAGTAGYHLGNPPDPRSVAVAAEHGIDIGGQRCRQFQLSDFGDFDHIFAMDRSNLAHIHALARTPEERSKAVLLRDAAGEGALEVPDPYYGGPEGFLTVYRILDAACGRILKNHLQ